jgi:hypothetical protein
MSMCELLESELIVGVQGNLFEPDRVFMPRYRSRS